MYIVFISMDEFICPPHCLIQKQLRLTGGSFKSKSMNYWCHIKMTCKTSYKLAVPLR